MKRVIKASACAVAGLFLIILDASAQESANTAIDEYRGLLAELDMAERYNESLGRKVAIQETLLASKRAELNQIDELKPKIRDLLRDMVADYGALIEDDIPYDMVERTARLARYQNQLSAEGSNDNIAQNFRLMLEALQIELDAGRSVKVERQVYLDENGQEVLDRNDEPEMLEYLRVGRVAYIRRNENLGIFEGWNQRLREWQTLPASYETGVEFGLRVAKEQAAPDVMFIPVLAPE